MSDHITDENNETPPGPFVDDSWITDADIEFAEKRRTGAITFARRKDRVSAADALAEAWAFIDGKVDAFRCERDETLARRRVEVGGQYEGYVTGAAVMIVRLRELGFDVVPLVSA